MGRFNKDMELQALKMSLGQFFEHMVMLSSSFRSDQINEYEPYDFGHTLLCYLCKPYMYNKPTSKAEFTVFCEWLMNELEMTCERVRYELFWQSYSFVNELDSSCERDGRELCGTII